jgi:glycine oxidase
MRSHYDVVIVGGGVIGLSLARELAGHDMQVAILERGTPGRETSWAGAGILPPANRATAIHPYDQLRGLSMELHPRWAAELRDETGLDTGFSWCGGLYLARSAGEAAALRGMALAWEDEQIAFERWNAQQVLEAEPALAEAAGPAKACYWLPGEAQLRNPWHLKALVASCRIRGVDIHSDREVTSWRREDARLLAAVTPQGEVHADTFCLCTGVWTQRLLGELHVSSSLLPIRGQMLLFRTPTPILRRIVNEGSRYLVPRPDGHLLVGSTEEEAGFDKTTTEAGLTELRQFACGLVPALENVLPVASWAGLRPATLDGLPYLGKIRGTSNGFLAAGHFRSGLYLSPGTARVMAQWIRHEPPEIDLAPFSLLRHGPTPRFDTGRSGLLAGTNGFGLS